MAITGTEQEIPGTQLFDGRMARKGYALNKMCYSFNDAANREAFQRDEEAYCARFGLNDEQRAAIKARNVLALLAAGATCTTLPSSPASSGWTCRTSARSRPA